jgi:hypothetical protein
MTEQRGKSLRQLNVTFTREQMLFISEQLFNFRHFQTDREQTRAQNIRSKLVKVMEKKNVRSYKK